MFPWADLPCLPFVCFQVNSSWEATVGRTPARKNCLRSTAFGTNAECHSWNEHVQGANVNATHFHMVHISGMLRTVQGSYQGRPAVAKFVAQQSRLCSMPGSISGAH